MTLQIPAGTKLGRYEIRSQIGAGGMGEVYLARDTELDRTVALKILPPELAADQQRMRRFVQEAKAASSLNHQNIVTIYEIGETNSTRFIATEFVDGITLRQRLKRGRLDLHAVLEIGIQIASGLTAAHEARVIHRDIKPENIMLRSRDGFVKVLDFGLVKLVEADNVMDTEAPTRALVNTDAGTVMGTVFYMSPEQTRGKPVDARTDIWSLGVILYEMVTGLAPFAGETSADVIAAIVKTEPKPIAHFVPEAPEMLSEIISKALEKDCDDRYQTIKDLLVDLRRLRKRLDFEAGLERSVSPESETHSVHASKGPMTATHAGSPTLSLDSARPTTSAEYIVSEIKRHKTGAIVGVLGLLALLSAAAYLWFKSSSPAPPKAAPAMKITKLTSGGRVKTALIDGSTSISPDGKYVVFTLMEAGKVSIWMRQISTGSDVQIVPPSEMRNGGTTISNDGEFVYYVGVNPGDPVNASLFQVPILGGTPRQILTRVRSPISFSPDGKQFTFVRVLDNQEGDALMVANADGSGERTLAVRKGNDWFSFAGPSWSPDGKIIACSAGSDTGGSHMTVMGYLLEEGTLKPLTPHKWTGEARRLLWLSDGSGLVVAAQVNPQSINPTQLWLVSHPDGAVRRITNDLNGYGGVSLGLTADSNTIVTVQSEPSIQIWTTNLGEPSNRARQITHGDADGASGIEWTPDGNIAFFAQIGEYSELWITKADGSDGKRLTKGNEASHDVSFSPNGKYVFFTSIRTGTPHIWRTNADGSNPKQITSGDFADVAPTCSPDGQWVLFSSWRSGKLCLWRVSVEGGEAVQITDRPSTRGFYSPDGKLIAAGYMLEESKPPWQLAIIPADGGKPLKVFAPTQGADLFAGIWWTADAQAVILMIDQGDVNNLWSQPIDGAKPEQITNFTSDLIYNYALSRDGKRLAISRGNASLDVVLIKDFR